MFKSLLILTGIFFLLFPFALFAQQPPLINPEEVISAAGKAIDDWQHLGWVAGIIALSGCLILTLRLSIVDSWLGEKNLKRFKPILSAVLGGVAGLFSTYATGANWPQSVLAGIAAGFAATGINQAYTQPIDNTMPAAPKG